VTCLAARSLFLRLSRREQGFKSNKKEWEAFATQVKQDIEDIQRIASSIGGYKGSPQGLREAIDHLVKFDTTPSLLLGGF
jgi:hypothetical protein